MLGRKSYTGEEIDAARTTVGRQLEAYRALRDAASGDAKAGAALDEMEVPYFNGMLLALDRPFVHRLRVGTGKDGNPLNEVELLVESLMNNAGALRGNNVIKYVPEESVLGLRAGDPIQLTVDDFDRLSQAFFAELERKFL